MINQRLRKGMRVWAPGIGLGTVADAVQDVVARVSWDNPYLCGETFSPPVPAQVVWHASQLRVLQ